MTSKAIEQQLTKGLKALGLEGETASYLSFLELLLKWNKSYNLTAIRQIEDMVVKHVFDSLAVHSFLQGDKILDIGSGAGLPGIPLAIACPNKQFVLLDSNGKKTRFMQTVKRVLNLKNLEVVQSRVESYQPSNTFATVISRAFADVKQMVALSHHLCDEGGVWLAMKGRNPEAEIAGLAYPWQCMPYHVPLLEGERCVVVIKHLSGNNYG